MKTAAVLFWILTWQAAAVWMHQPVLLVSPLQVVKRLCEMSMEKDFWLSAGGSLLGITAGFLLAVTVGVLLGALSRAAAVLSYFFYPLMSVLKSTPVASFIILALIFIPSSRLNILISFIMVVPVIYFNVCQGIDSTDPQLLEMCRIFRPGRLKMMREIYVPAVRPYLQSACTIGFGFAWKSGIAAEVIGLPRHTIGSSLYNAKIYLNTPDLYAWTLVVILLSLLLEKVIARVLRLKA